MSPPAVQLPHALEIEPRGPIDAEVRVPGSKSLTNRALLAAALADGESLLRGPLASDDTDRMREALGAMGVGIDNSDPDCWRVAGTGGRLRAPSSTLDVGNAGTAARFLTAAATLAHADVVLDGNERMRQRPISDLSDALTALGAEIETLGDGGCPPLRIHAAGLPGGSAEIDASRSSQYVSAVLLAAPYAERDVTLRLRDGRLVSRPYVDLTLQVMHAFGAHAGWQEGDEQSALVVTAGRHYRATDYEVEPDASSAAYAFCAAAIAGGRVRLTGIPQDTRQADFALVDILEKMGCRVERTGRPSAPSSPRSQRVRATAHRDRTPAYGHSDSADSAPAPSPT